MKIYNVKLGDDYHNHDVGICGTSDTKLKRVLKKLAGKFRRHVGKQIARIEHEED
jgi:hypothetical protein